MKVRSMGAVCAGLAANFLAVPVDALLHAAGVFPPPGSDMGDGLFGVALAYRIACAVLGGWVVARLAPSSAMKHAAVLGVLGVLLSSLGAAAQWNVGHHWYPVSLVLMSLPATWAGATLSQRS